MAQFSVTLFFLFLSLPLLDVTKHYHREALGRTHIESPTFLIYMLALYTLLYLVLQTG